jgi:hypothetical protein
MFAAKSTSKRGRYGCMLCIAGIVLLALMGPTATAGTLLTIPGACSGYQGGVYGVAGYIAEFDYTSYTADLNFAVFKDSVPTLGLSFPGRYIYTYQLFNWDSSNDSITTFDLGLYATEISRDGINRANVYGPDGTMPSDYVAGSVSDPTPTDPTSRSWSTISVTDNSLHWNFDTFSTSVMPGEQSDILYFVSPYSPYLSNASFSAAAAVNMENIPVPEPATGMMAIFGGIGLILAVGVRRVYCRI